MEGKGFAFWCDFCTGWEDGRTHQTHRRSRTRRHWPWRGKSGPGSACMASVTRTETLGAAPASSRSSRQTWCSHRYHPCSRSSRRSELPASWSCPRTGSIARAQGRVSPSPTRRGTAYVVVNWSCWSEYQHQSRCCCSTPNINPEGGKWGESLAGEAAAGGAYCGLGQRVCAAPPGPVTSSWERGVLSVRARWWFPRGEVVASTSTTTVHFTVYTLTPLTRSQAGVQTIPRQQLLLLLIFNFKSWRSEKTKQMALSGCKKLTPHQRVKTRGLLFISTAERKLFVFFWKMTMLWDFFYILFARLAVSCCKIYFYFLATIQSWHHAVWCDHYVIVPSKQGIIMFDNNQWWTLAHAR